MLLNPLLLLFTINLCRVQPKYVQGRNSENARDNHEGEYYEELFKPKPINNSPARSTHENNSEKQICMSRYNLEHKNPNDFYINMLKDEINKLQDLIQSLKYQQIIFDKLSKSNQDKDHENYTKLSEEVAALKKLLQSSSGVIAKEQQLDSRLREQTEQITRLNQVVQELSSRKNPDNLAKVIKKLGDVSDELSHLYSKPDEQVGAVNPFFKKRNATSHKLRSSEDSLLLDLLSSNSKKKSESDLTKLIKTLGGEDENEKVLSDLKNKILIEQLKQSKQSKSLDDDGELIKKLLVKQMTSGKGKSLDDDFDELESAIRNLQPDEKNFEFALDKFKPSKKLSKAQILNIKKMLNQIDDDEPKHQQSCNDLLLNCKLQAAGNFGYNKPQYEGQDNTFHEAPGVYPQNNYKDGNVPGAAAPQQFYPDDYKQQISDLKGQVSELENYINVYNKPEYMQKPQNKETVYALEKQISDLKNVVNSLNTSDNYQEAPAENYDGPKRYRRNLDQVDRQMEKIGNLLNNLLEEDEKNSIQRTAGFHYKPIKFGGNFLSDGKSNQRAAGEYHNKPSYDYQPNLNHLFKNKLDYPMRNNFEEVEEKEKPFKTDIFDKIFSKIIDKVIKFLPQLLSRLFGVFFGEEIDFNKHNLLGIIPLMLTKILSNISYIFSSLQRFKFVRTFLIPAGVLLLVAGAIIFLIWWLQPVNGQNYNYKQLDGYNNDYNNNEY